MSLSLPTLLYLVLPPLPPSPLSLPQVASKLKPEDKSTIEKKVKEVLDWLDHNQLAEVEEFEDQQKELEHVCSPIITAMYQGAGGGMPDMGAGAGPRGGHAPGGPTVEEVD